MCHDWLLLNAVPNAFGTATNSDNNLFNLQNRMVRADTAFAMVTFAAAELEGNDFLALLVLVNDLGGHARAFDVGLADLDFLAVGNQQNVFQRDLLALFAVEEFDLQNVAGLDAILLGTCSYYCVHECVLFLLGRDKKHNGSQRLRQRLSCRPNAKPISLVAPAPGPWAVPVAAASHPSAIDQWYPARSAAHLHRGRSATLARPGSRAYLPCPPSHRSLRAARLSAGRRGWQSRGSPVSCRSRPQCPAAS